MIFNWAKLSLTTDPWFKSGEEGMDAIEIANLTEIMKLQYSHVCLNYGDLTQFTIIPAQKKNYYECPSRAARIAGKRGFIINASGGQTMCWSDWRMDHCMVKIAFNIPADTTKGWSDPMPFKTEEDVMKIYKIMKLKAFW